MARHIQGKDGKFRGSIGHGKNNTPTAAPTPPHTPGSPAAGRKNPPRTVTVHTDPNRETTISPDGTVTEYTFDPNRGQLLTARTVGWPRNTLIRRQGRHAIAAAWRQHDLEPDPYPNLTNWHHNPEPSPTATQEHVIATTDGPTYLARHTTWTDHTHTLDITWTDPDGTPHNEYLTETDDEPDIAGIVQRWHRSRPVN